MVKSCVIIIKENNTISIYEAPFLNVIKVIPIIHQKKFKMSEKIASFNHKKKYLKKKSDLRNNNNDKNNNKEIFSRRFYLDRLLRWSDHLVNYFSLMHRCWINTDSLLLTFSCREIYLFLLILFEMCVFGAAHG